MIISDPLPGLVASMPQLGGVLGSALSFGTLSLLSLLSPQSFLLYGWRSAFLASAVLIFLGLYIRARVDETPQFVALASRGGLSRTPLWEAVRDSPKLVMLVRDAVLVGAGRGSLLGGMGYLWVGEGCGSLWARGGDPCGRPLTGCRTNAVHALDEEPHACVTR
jgi:MFS family permease